MADLSATFAARVATELPVQQVAAWVRAYTRGNGHDQPNPANGALLDWPRPEIQAAILSAADRLASSGGSIVSQSVDGAEVRYAPFQGFTLVEQMILHDYRRRAA